MIVPNRPDAAPASSPASSAPAYELPPVGGSPSTLRQGSSPGSFARRGRVGTPWTFSSPDTPGMPAPSDKTAWDFMPADWEVQVLPSSDADGVYASSPCEACAAAQVFTDSV